MPYKIVFIDFDGTLFSREKTISPNDVKVLQNFGKQGIVRVIATGRSYFSIRKVIPEDFPIDFVILSTGAGIIDWRSKRLIKSFVIKQKIVQELIHTFVQKNESFFVHDPLPNNHYFYFYTASNLNPDFQRRLNLYAKFARPLAQRPDDLPASQFLLIETDFNKIQRLVNGHLDDLNLVKATSPLDGKSFWLEIFDKRVSKGKAAQWLCEYLKIPQQKTVAIGNDYNDVDLLAWVKKSYVVPDAPQELLNNFEILPKEKDSILARLLHQDVE